MVGRGELGVRVYLGVGHGTEGLASGTRTLKHVAWNLEREDKL